MPFLSITPLHTTKKHKKKELFERVYSYTKLFPSDGRIFGVVEYSIALLYIRYSL